MQILAHRPVFFPVSGPHLQPAILEEKSSDFEQSSGTILIVDDEPTVLRLGVRVLESSGYDVLTASNGQEGVDVFREHFKDIALVLLDFKMPRLSGDEALIEMKKIDPNVAAILISGFTEDEVKMKFEESDLVGILRKPYLPSQLLKLIGDVLSEDTTIN